MNRVSPGKPWFALVLSPFIEDVSVERMRIRVNSPTVVSEVIEGEAVIMNLTTGRYFSCQGVGGEMWGLIEQGATRDQILNHCQTRYSVDSADLDQALTDFLASLNEHDLIREEVAEGSETDSETPLPESYSKSAFQPPILNVYSDMEDLLLLDPIHDVDETGWPQPKPATEQSS
jgi:hypothetical protein